MKKILVTGADGFIGSHLVEKLLEQNYDVKAFVLYNAFNNWGWIDSYPKEIIDSIEVFCGDIRDENSVRKACKGVDTIFHLAALIGIPYSYHAPSSYIDTNIKGTLNLLQASLDYNIEKIIVTSTSEVYGTALYVPIDEKHPRQGQSPYSASKIGADSLAESFYRSFNLPVTIARPFNTYGPRQSARAVIPTIISQLLNGVTDLELGSLLPTRDLVFVKDTVNGFIEIAKSDKLNGNDVNIATGTEISIGNLANKLIQLINPSAKIKTMEERLRPVNSEVERLLGSKEKITLNTKWKQQFILDEGLKLTIDWFSNKENIKRYKHNIYNV
jgi:NAD dependent epimerase/dehydratase